MPYNKGDDEMNQEDYDVIVIGGGLSALTCGFILARDKKRVLIIEKNPFVGGVCSSYERDGFIFDRGPQVFPSFSKGFQLDNFFREFGLKKRLNMKRPTNPLKISLPSGTLDVPAGLSNFKSALKEKYPSEEKGIEGLFNTISKLKEELYKIEARRRMTLIRFLIFWARHPNVVRYHKKTFSSLIKRYIEDESLKTYLTAPWIYVGLPPSKISALTLSLMISNIYDGGIYYPEGGSSTLAETLVYGYQRYGGKLLLGSEVDSILVDVVRDVPVVKGVRVGDRIFRSKYVVSSVDPRHISNLLEGVVYKKYTESFQKINPSLSVVRLMLGIKGEKLNTKAHDTLLFEYENPDEVYSELLKGNVAFCGITIPSLTDESLAPKGHEVVCVRTLLPGEWWKQNGSQKQERVVSSLLERAEVVVPNIENRIVVRELQTPETTSSVDGSVDSAIFGWAPTPDVIQKKMPTQQTPIKGLLLTGRWSQPGGGVVHAMESGWIAAFKIIKFELMEASSCPTSSCST
jgi:prolycopene isomerase